MTKMLDVAVLALAVLALAGCNPDPQSLITKAQAYRQKGDYKAAIIALKNVLQKNPKHPEARYLLGLSQNDAGDFRGGEAELRRALELNYDKAKVVPALGKSLLMIGEFQKVLEQIPLRTDASNPAQAEILTLRGRALVALGKSSEGRALFEQALVKQPEFSAALLGLASMAASGKNLDEATNLIERAIASTPKSVDAWLMKGDLSRLKADQAGAMAAYQKVVEIHPDNIAARVNMASMLIAADKLDEARAQITQARKIAPNSPMATFMLGLIEYHARNYSAAGESVQRVLKMAPGYLPNVLLAGMVDFAQGSHAKAQTHLETVLARAPGHLYARRLLIASLLQSGQIQRAEEALQVGFNYAPEDGELMALAGEVYLQSNDLAKASEYFARAAKLSPKDANVRARLGVTRLAQGETDRGLADLESAVQLEPEKYQMDVILITSQLQQGNFDQALNAMRGLEEKQPKNPLTYNLKASIYLGKKDIPSARKQLERALELQPTFVPAALNLAQLDLQDNNPQAARRRLEVIVEKDKGNVQALLTLADLGPRFGATQKERIDWLERARTASPRSVAPHMMLARLYSEAADNKAALASAQQALSIAPDDPQVLDFLGTIQIAAGDNEQALATYAALVAKQPKSPGALVRLARAQEISGRLPESASTLKKALELQPDFTAAQLLLAYLELRAERFPTAMKIAREVQKQTAKSPAGFVLEGDILMAEKKFAEAAKAYESALGLVKSSEVVVKLSAAYSQGGKPQEAEARLAQWLKESPADLRVRVIAAETGIRSARYKIAIEHYEWLRDKQPDNVLALNNLAYAYQQMKDPRALETAERAYKLKSESDNAEVSDTLGWILVEQGNTTRGLELLQKALAAAPKSSDIRYHLAQAWMKSGNKPKARAELENLLAADAKFPQQKEALALLERLRE